MRQRRDISPTGYLQCSRCQDTKHISQFYQASGAYVCVTEDGEDHWYGKPNSWCKSCVKDHKQLASAGPKVELQARIDRVQAVLDQLKVQMEREYPVVTEKRTPAQADWVDLTPFQG